MNSLTNIQENSDEKILWQMMELMMNVGPELFIQSQGIQAGKDILYDYLGIREEIINVIAEEFSDKVSEDEYHSNTTKFTDDTSDKILSDIRNGHSPINILLQELIKNQQFVGENMNSLVLIFSSIFMKK